jgi:serine/threonine protein kinase/TPR repeat protein
MTKHLRYQHFEIIFHPDGTPHVLGRGSMGVTYKAFDTNLHRHVALKIIAPDLLGDDLTRERFQREARVAAAIRHPQVAAVSYLGEEDEEIFYAMEFIEGITLDQKIREQSQLAPAMALEIAGQVCQALAALHRQGLVHRDIKPSNIMLMQGGEDELRVKLVDFGLAKFLAGNFTSPALAQASAAGFHGTPYYASPEQINGQEVDIRSDIYSLGVTVFTMLSGHVPFSGSFAQVLSQHLTRPPPLETLQDLPADVRRLVGRMLAKDPADRYRTPAELRAGLEAALQTVVGPRDSLPAADARVPANEKPSPAGLNAPRRLTLLELMKTRRALPLQEALILLHPIAARLDTSTRVPGLTLADITIPSADLVGGHLTESMPPSVAFSDDSVMPANSSPDATVVPALNLAQDFQTAPRVLAFLAYELLGGMRAQTAGRWMPLTSLSAEANAALRDAIERLDAYETAAALVTALGSAKPLRRKAPDPIARTPLPTSQGMRNASQPVAPGAVKARLAPLGAVLSASVIFGVALVATGVWFFLHREPPKDARPNRAVPLGAATSSLEKPPAETRPPEEQNVAGKQTRSEDPSAPFLQAAERAKETDNDAEAFKNFSRALDASPDKKGPREEMEMIAARLRSNAGQLTPEKFALLRAPLEQAASHNVVSAQMLLGEWLRKSDPRVALKWFAAAAAQGQTEAMTQAGLMMANGLGNDSPDFSAAVAWFQQGAAGGDTDAMVSLADCLLHGKGIAKNEAQAVELLRTASALEHPSAMNMLGDLLKKGVPGTLDPNPSEAFGLFARAKDMGFLDAQANLGVMYVNGFGVPMDRDHAVKLWKDGAARGNALNMYFYAMALEGGLTGAPQPVAARQWYEESAKRGNQAAATWCRKHATGREVNPGP